MEATYASFNIVSVDVVVWYRRRRMILIPACALNLKTWSMCILTLPICTFMWENVAELFALSRRSTQPEFHAVSEWENAHAKREEEGRDMYFATGGSQQSYCGYIRFKLVLHIARKTATGGDFSKTAISVEKEDHPIILPVHTLNTRRADKHRNISHSIICYRNIH